LFSRNIALERARGVRHRAPDRAAEQVRNPTADPPT